MPDKPAPLVPIREELVEFYGDEIPTVIILDESGEEAVYVAVRAVCEFIGVDWSAQYRRIQRDPVLDSVSRSVAITATQLDRKPGQRATQDMLCLPTSFLHGFLFGINASRAKAGVRDALIRYQRECYAVLAGAFTPSRVELGSRIDRMEAILQDLAGGTKASLESSQHAHQRLDKAGAVIRDLFAELEKINERIGSGQRLTEEQAADIQARALETAGLLARIPGNGGRKNPYAAIYAALKRDFKVTSYRNIPIHRYEEAVAWMESYYEMFHTALEGGGESTGLLEAPDQ
jgi:hypothetical protein